MAESFEFRDSTHFTAGAIGEPGHRTFFLQAGDENSYVSVKIEKQQVAALAGFLRKILADLPSPDVIAPAPLIEPALPEWAVGQIAVGLDEVTQEIVLVVTEFQTQGEEEEVELATEDESELRVHITPSQATSFISATDDLMASGRPPCRLCGNPMDPEGHACPRLN